MVQKFTDTEAYADECVFFWTINNANIFLGLIEYGLNYISVHIRLDLERYLLIMWSKGS